METTIRWPKIKEDTAFDSSFYKIISIITGVDEVSDAEVLIFIEVFPRIFSLLNYEGICEKMLLFYKRYQYPLDTDILFDFHQLLEEKEKAPKLSVDLLKLICEFGLLDINVGSVILNLIEKIPSLNDVLMNFHRGISYEVETIINCGDVIKYFSPTDIELIGKMDLLTLSSLFMVSSLYILDKSEIKPEWSKRWIDETQYMVHSNILSFLGVEELKFPNDYDIESIIKHYGVVFPYGSRSELLTFYQNIQSGRHVFVVLNNCNKKPENETLYFSLDSIENVKEVLIGVGNLNSFKVTTLTELEEVWDHGLKNKQEFFQSPFHLEPMNSALVNGIIEIADYVKNENIIKVWRELKDFIRHSKSSEGQMVKRYENCSPQEQSIIRKVVKQIFLTGMYMRRWSGSGPYPYSSSETTENDVPYWDIIEFSINEGLDEEYDENNDIVLAKVAKEIFYLKSLYEKLSDEGKDVIHRMNTYDVDNGRSKQNPFWTGIGKRVMENDYCIRMASSSWVGSSAKFFQLIGKRAKFLYGFDISRIEAIS